MNTEVYKYIAITTNGLKKKRTIVNQKDVKEPFKLPDSFKSWCKFDKSIISYQKSNKGSLRGYKGLCYSDFMPVDIDNNKEPHKTLNSCKEIIGFLECNYSVPVDALRIYFSGSKGFHIEIPSILFGDVKPSINLPNTFKSIANKFNFSDIDTKIYYSNGMWRLPNSINSKSGLYKLPISYKLLIESSYSDLCALATNPSHNFPSIPFSDWSPIKELEELFLSEDKLSRNITQYDINKKNQIEFDGVKEGNRNRTAFIISRTLKSRGYTLNEAKDYVVNIWNPKNNPPETDMTSLRRTVESAYSYNYYDSGSIALTKHLRADPYFNSMDMEQRGIYIYLITHLNEVKKEWRGYTINPNQCIISLRKLADELSVGEQRIRTLLKNLENDGRISVKTLYKKGRATCSRITFFNIDLTQYLTQQNDLSKNSSGSTQQLTSTNIAL